ncbi:MAG: DUF2461 domain-containing protein, partial [Ferruginibacter sp.]
MLSKNTLQFLSALAQNNNKTWFDANKITYEAAKKDFETFAEKLIKQIGRFDKNIEPLQVKRCTFRQYRDVRFSKDKRPLKINMGAYFNAGGKKLNTAGYYFHLEHGKSMLAAGLWSPETQALTNVRQEVDYNFEDFTSIVGEKSFRKYFPEGLSKEGSLQRPPNRYEADNPAINYLKLKSFIVRRILPDDVLLQPDLLKTTVAGYQAAKP